MHAYVVIKLRRVSMVIGRQLTYRTISLHNALAKPLQQRGAKLGYYLV